MAIEGQKEDISEQPTDRTRRLRIALIMSSSQGIWGEICLHPPFAGSRLPTTGLFLAWVFPDSAPSDIKLASISHGC